MGGLFISLKSINTAAQSFRVRLMLGSTLIITIIISTTVENNYIVCEILIQSFENHQLNSTGCGQTGRGTNWQVGKLSRLIVVTFRDPRLVAVLDATIKFVVPLVHNFPICSCSVHHTTNKRRVNSLCPRF